MKTKRKEKKLTWAKFKTFIPLYLMLLPGLIYFFINNYMPMTGIIVAFKKYSKRKGIFGSDWCGLDNFEYLLKMMPESLYEIHCFTMLFSLSSVWSWA